ncbi:MAG: c-type cytochrome biogenesis protein CcsB [Candidatus Obscuribacterales bacterium]|nr:c-type cytochrome biogenesis protein CcsB [Candidatus Obscuribacterales bacterium]
MPDIQTALTNTAGISSVLSFWVFVGSNAFNKHKELLLKIAYGVLSLGFIALSAGIVMRGIDAGRFPLSNLYESLLWFAWAIMGGFLLMSRSYDLKQLGWLASLTAICFFLYGSWLPADQHAIKPLVPALVSYWRQIHVPPLIVSYAMFFIAGLSAFIQLWQAGRLRSVFLALFALIAASAAIVLGTFTDSNSFLLQGLFVGGSLSGIGSAWWQLSSVNQNKQNPELADTFDEIVYRAIAIGFPLLTIGIITGGLWANHAWGSYWSWDPKESMALTTWLGYAAYIHMRINKELSAEKLSLIAIAGMLITLLTYLGFNSLGFGGLHSYGKFK